MGTMKEQSKLELTTTIQAKVEKTVAEALPIMAQTSKMSADEIINTALRRFIATHQDYFPPKKKG
jgi:hypothetical protein